MYWVVLLILISMLALAIINYMWQREKNRREAEHEKRMDRFDKLMDELKKNKEPGKDE